MSNRVFRIAWIRGLRVVMSCRDVKGSKRWQMEIRLYRPQLACVSALSNLSMTRGLLRVTVYV
jgi:hypothetical protein